MPRARRRDIAPPASIAGHVTHQPAGAAGLYRLRSASKPSRTRALTANFDAGKTAALAQTMLDWAIAGRAGAQLDSVSWDALGAWRLIIDARPT